ncbi:hypothetical protein H5410_059593 [Solanum commersonii]|uniref:Uncharacterized protein n=1 Tax=Solanum commersonii TaxID=4109 RepID=A0A9J5W2T6_SOLCO|nr:hypothetical protein H5410_059593 [Solanum commersonii]
MWAENVVGGDMPAVVPDFISTKKILLISHDVHTLNPMSSAGSSTQLNTNLSNIENQRRHSKETGIFYVNMQSFFRVHRSSKLTKAKFLKACGTLPETPFEIPTTPFVKH